MTDSYSGGCACGAIRYECTSGPLLSVNCRCRDCQRASGSAYASVLVVHKAAFIVTGVNPKYHRVIADNGNAMARGFCPQCGSPLFLEMAAFADAIGIQAASLDDPSRHLPTAEVWTVSAQPWDYLNPNIAHFPNNTTQAVALGNAKSC